MPTGAVLDFDRLMTPILADHPAGEEDFRSVDSTKYFELRKLRDDLKKAEENALFGGDEGPDASWSDLLQDATDALATQTKDVQLLCWMLEALPRLHGFAGLRDGLKLLHRLVDQYLPELFPRPDEEGVHEDEIYTCVEPFGRLDSGPLPDAVAQVVVTQGSGPGPFTLGHYEQAVDLSSRDSDTQQELISQGWVSLEVFEEAVRDSSDSFYINLYEDLQECDTVLTDLNTLLEEKCGEQDGVPLNPSIRSLKNRLEAAGRHIRTFAASSLEKVAAAAVEAAEESDSGSSVNTASVGTGKASAPAARTREAAFRELEEISTFFRKSEPHSVLSYMLEQAVRYGRMSLPDLLNEILPDDDERRKLFRHVGIIPPRSNDD